MIRDIKPTHILIEAPYDFNHHIDTLLDIETKPPVAIASIVKKDAQSRIAAYYPFCTHSPEFVALQEGQSIKASLSFIDLPSSDKAMLYDAPRGQAINLQREQAFDSGDFIQALCDTLGCRDGYELWDHLFETRLGGEDWQSFFADVGAYCAGLRSATADDVIESNGDAARETFMAGRIVEVLSPKNRVLVVAGGFHIPALIALTNKKTLKKVKANKADNQSYIIRYGFAAMDALSGYGAGLPQPGYYDYLWEQALQSDGSPNWREIALDLSSSFTTHLRERGEMVSVPAQVEMLRTAEQLALMRGRPGALRHDLIDGVQAALTKGEASRNDIWVERLKLYLQGTKLGDVPASAGSPPLVEEARRLARSLRIDVSDSARRQRKLDIRRKVNQLKASQFFHAMSLLETTFAEKQVGPDYLNNVRTELLFEEWSYAWSPAVEGRLIEASIYGDQVETACVNFILAKREEQLAEGQGRNLETLVTLLGKGLLAGLGKNLHGFLNALEGDVQNFGDFNSVAGALERLTILYRSSGPMGAPKDLNIQGVMRSAYAKLIYLCDDIHNTPEDAISGRIKALRLVVELLRGSDGALFDTSLFDDAIERIASQNPPPKIMGAVLAICVQGGQRTASELATALSGNIHGSVTTIEERIDVLVGILQTVPSLLWQEEEVLSHIDNFLCGIEERDFITLLPHLRLAFTDLNPRETDRLAELLSKKHSGRASDFTTGTAQLSDTDLQDYLQIDATLKETLEKDGLSNWIFGDEANNA
jgi:hypothetical protein